MTANEIEQMMRDLEEEMLAAAEELRFEYAAKLRDEIRDLRRELDAATTLKRGYSVVENSQIAIPSITRPSTSTIAISSATGTCQPNQVTPGT